MTERIFLHKLGARISSVVFWVILVYLIISFDLQQFSFYQKQFESLPFASIAFFSLANKYLREYLGHVS